MVFGFLDYLEVLNSKQISGHFNVILNNHCHCIPSYTPIDIKYLCTVDPRFSGPWISGNPDQI